MANGLNIDSDFPGGNIVVDEIVGDVVKLHQDLRDTEGDWFYWYFWVRGAQNRKLTFQFTKSIAVGVNGAAVSLDNGETWSWTGKDSVHENTFCFTFPPDADDVRFCTAIPYFENDLAKFLSGFSGNDYLKLETLCKSEQGRVVELIRLGCINSEPKARILLTCRHHCCEMIASYSLEGIMQSVLNSDSPETAWLRDNVEFLIIPFVDKDGVENGDQGKNRRPHDHNRDYGDLNIYNSVKAIKELVAEQGGGKLKIAFDLHCPYLKGGEHNERIYMVGSPYDIIWKQQQAFSEILAKFADNPLPFAPASNLPFGQGWNVANSYSAGKSFCKWAAESIAGIKLASTIEIPYSNVDGATVTQDAARNFGQALARSFGEYLKKYN